MTFRQRSAPRFPCHTYSCTNKREQTNTPDPHASTKYTVAPSFYSSLDSGHLPKNLNSVYRCPRLLSTKVLIASLSGSLQQGQEIRFKTFLMLKLFFLTEMRAWITPGVCCVVDLIEFSTLVGMHALVQPFPFCLTRFSSLMSGGAMKPLEFKKKNALPFSQMQHG